MPETPATQSHENSRFSGGERSAAHASSLATARILAVTLAVVPMSGIPGEWVLQDTLKSALLAFGVIVAALVFVWSRLQT